MRFPTTGISRSGRRRAPMSEEPEEVLSSSWRRILAVVKRLETRLGLEEEGEDGR